MRQDDNLSKLKKKIDLVDATMLAFPLPVSFITTYHKCNSGDTKHNIATISYNSIGCEQGLQLIEMAMRPNRYSYKNITKTREFGVNIPTYEMYNELVYCGSNSGETVNKFERLRFKYFYGKGNIILIEDCPINIVCRVLDDKEGKLFGTPFDGIVKYTNITPLSSHHKIIGQIMEMYMDKNFDVEANKLVVTTNYAIREVGRKLIHIKNWKNMEIKERELYKKII